MNLGDERDHHPLTAYGGIGQAAPVAAAYSSRR
jgi:hypothetical protein